MESSKRRRLSRNVTHRAYRPAVRRKRLRSFHQTLPSRRRGGKVIERSEKPSEHRRKSNLNLKFGVPYRREKKKRTRCEQNKAARRRNYFAGGTPRGQTRRTHKC